MDHGAAAAPGAVSYGFLTPELVDPFVQMLVDAHEGLGGTRDPKVLRRVALDALPPDGQAVISTATVDGRLVGTVIALVGGSRLFWQRFILRHPIVGARLLAQRARDRGRWGVNSRLGRGSSEPTGEVARKDAPTPAEEALGIERPAPGEGPHLRDSGDDVAFGALALVAGDQRGRGVGVRVYQQLFIRLRERGITNYRGSIRFGNEASVRMCAALGFTIFRYADGWFVAIDLAAVAP